MNLAEAGHRLVVAETCTADNKEDQREGPHLEIPAHAKFKASPG
jgi:hypothetical protein